jgi:hypothetical protein
MPPLRRVTVPILGLLCLGLTQRVVAQSAPELNVEHFVPATSPDGFLGVQATRTPGPGRYTLLLSGSYEAQPLSLDAGTQYDLRQIRTRVAAWVGAEVGLGGRMAVGALLPAYPYQRAAFTAHTPSYDESLGFAVGDALLQARYRLLGESSSHADAPKDGPGVAFEARGALPTHSGAAVAGEVHPSAELHLLADFQLLGAGVGGDLGVRHRFGGTLIQRQRMVGAQTVADPISFHDALLFGAAIKLPLPPLPSLVTVLELRGATDFRSAAATSLELDLGAHLGLGACKLSVGGGLGLSRGLGTPDGRLLVGLSYTPRDADTDADGVDDDEDECPFLGEDKDGFQDHDGCPDPDNDNDLIPDLDDLCPNDSAEEGMDEDENGCTDGTKNH